MSRILATSAPTPRRSTRRPAGCFGNSNWTNIRPRVSPIRRRCIAALSTYRYRRSRKPPAPAATISAAAFAAAWWHWMHGLARASGRLSHSGATTTDEKEPGRYATVRSVGRSGVVGPDRRCGGNTLYVATGNSASNPAADTSDAVIALDLNIGRMQWHRQLTANDAYITGCSTGRSINPTITAPTMISASHRSWCVSPMANAFWRSGRSQALCTR